MYRLESMVTYLFKGSSLRRSRLHNFRGERLDVRGLLYLPHSVVTTIWLKLTGRRPEVPWLGYRAVKSLSALIQPRWRILEFGSGMSTVWFARRCTFVLSLETDELWLAKVRELLDRAGLENADCRLCSTTADGAPDFGAAVSSYSDPEFDLVLVDGARRDLAMEIALASVKPGGYVFLDNSDFPNEDSRIAAAMLAEAVGANPRIWVFNDFCPGVVMVNEGTLVRVGEP